MSSVNSNAAGPLRTPEKPLVLPSTASRPPNRRRPAGGPADMSAVMAQLAQLGQLRDSGVLNSEEFEAQKKRILGG